jgi:WD40 repeat protein
MVTSTVFCDTCGAANKLQSGFCYSCGQSLQVGAQPPQAIFPVQKVPASSLDSGHILQHRYRIIDRVGKGGMGAVYMAEDIQLGQRLVAVKEMQHDSSNSHEMAKAIDAFGHEALMLAELMHPNLPRIYDHFPEGGRWYLIMDFIEGETLEERLRRIPGGYLPVEEVLDIGIQLCTVLDYLHTRRTPVIFRDLKPANLMLDAVGHLYLIDFGIARHFKPGKSSDTAHLGSVGYAAPEQYGKAQTTARSDIYGLGATLHHLLSGNDPAQTPFRFAPLHQIEQPVPDDLQVLISQMVEIEETKRPVSMAAIKHALQRIAAQQAGKRGESPSTSPGRLSPMQHPVGATLFVYQGHTGRVLAVSWSPDGRHIASGGNDKTVQVWNAHTAERITLYGEHTEWVHAVSWSPDGRHIASAGADMSVRVWDAFTGKTISVYRGHVNIVTSLAWSPDGRSIASGSYDKTVQVWHVISCDRLFTYHGHHGLVNAVAWLTSGDFSLGQANTTLIASASDDKTVQVWDFARRHKCLYTYRGHTGWVKTIDRSPDSMRIASGSWDNTVQVWDATTGKFAITHRDHTSWVNALAWSPTSSLVASGSNDKTVQIWHASDGREPFARRTRFTYTGHIEWVRSVTWSPDGTRVASAGHDWIVRVWQAV